MHYRGLGDSSLQVSEISLGSWLTLGSSVDRTASRALVLEAFELGVNLFDTADVYAEGEAERVLGSALADLPRERVVVASKCFFPSAENPAARGLSRKHVTESVTGSLRRMGTDYIDLYQCHRADPGTPIEETVDAFSDLIRQGKLRHWGVSMWSAAQIEEACRVAQERQGCAPISNQPQYSLLRREIEAEILPTCRRLGLGQLAWSPLAQGVLSGKYATGVPENSRAADAFRGQFMSDFLSDETRARVEELRTLAADAQLGIAALALAWCLRDPGISSLIVGVTRREQLVENVSASGQLLPDEILARVDALFPLAPAASTSA